MNEYNERSTWRRMRALLSINDPRWGRGDGKGNDGSRPRANESKRPPGGDGDGPPDLDEMWRNFNRRLSGLFGGKGGNGFRPDNGRAARVGVGIVIGVLVAVYAGSGLFVVQDGQTGVVLQFGKLSGTVGQGVHWRAPYPFASHEIVDTSQVRSIEIGRNNVVRLANVKEAAMLTRDADIVDVRFIVQYRIRSATDYLFRSVDPERSVSQAAQAAVRAIVGTRSAADMLNQDRDALREQLSTAIQRDLDRYQSGLEITSVTMQSVAAPEQTQAAYAEVAKAREDREAAKRAAQAYANDLLPKAQGDAAKLADEAKAYADRVVTEAEGDADRFKQVYAQYSKAPAVIRERMYLETMQDIYSKATKVFVGNKGGNSVVYLPLDKLVEQGRQNAANAALPAGASAPDAASAPAAAASSAPASAPSASAAAAPAPGSDVLRSREAFRSRSREDDTK
ncbi:TPA: FtsH protease activity modulator HflK [Burkholderia territorii]|uniref:FtsH protease activity modulator HflK n=1 Tax=Burkholderia territorii TaxID=1503055 RepID=UPI0011CBC809|nr:FtsH protease activity modulator HflK [Burkholderia territorii]TXG19820.1 FtsH protease activity modulator HflK [Burkholderia territorii]HDR8860395.1 FtsH protease activity modulator HflK [Burkholderia territorii]HDR8873045.1 FtsH protease activity modulator HflK [Burkholderia territorii]HDR8879733.1 FtsH protease activity modulator HflK [Burkholderia territorii]HDR8885461.1 FtsH protease activity modulator HflK [Burkholderia territorii]